MSQKNPTNAEKGKQLMTARKRMGFSQSQLGERLNLDPTYISQLENGHREVDEFYVMRAEEMARDFDNASRIQAMADPMRAPSGRVSPSRETCLQYFNQFLETCTDAAKLGWTAVELKDRFPLDKWQRLNSVPDAVAQQAAKRAVAGVRQPGVVSGRSRKAASTSGKTSSRASRAGGA